MVLTVADVSRAALEALLEKYGLNLQLQPDAQAITGSYWGDSEAGIVDQTVFVRNDTPVHSLLHETCHLICMSSERRAQIDTDAGGDDLEEAAVCYLQVLLAEHPSHLEEGMELLEREYATDIGPVDLLCRDAEGRVVAFDQHLLSMKDNDQQQFPLARGVLGRQGRSAVASAAGRNAASPTGGDVTIGGLSPSRKHVEHDRSRLGATRCRAPARSAAVR